LRKDAKDARRPPEKVDEDINALTSNLGVERKDAFWLSVESAPMVTLSDMDKLRAGFRGLAVHGAEQLSEKDVQTLKDSLCGISVALMQSPEKSFSEYGRIMKEAGHSLRNRSELIKYLSSAAGGEADYAKMTDEQLFSAYCKHLGFDPAWEGIGFQSSSVYVHNEQQLPKEGIGGWAGDLMHNIRTWNPCFVSDTKPETMLNEKRSLFFADAALTVQRSQAWGGRIVQFHLRYWLNETSHSWQLLDAAMVKETPSYADPTLFLF
jgi:hypothetical protein